VNEVARFSVGVSGEEMKKEERVQEEPFYSSRVTWKETMEI